MTTDDFSTLRLHTAEDARRFRGMGVWSTRTFNQLVSEHADVAGDKLAICDGDVRWDYRTLIDRARRIATVLRDHGVGEGDVVITQLPNSALLAAVHLATGYLGAIFAPVSMAWRATELRPLLATSRAKALIAGLDRTEHPQVNAAGLRALGEESVIVIHSGTGTRDSLERQLDAAEPIRPEDQVANPDPNAPMMTMCSSGSSGAPKISLVSSNNLFAQSMAVGREILLTAADVTAVIAPASTGSAGYVYLVAGALIRGATACLLPVWDKQAAVDLIGREGCTLAMAVPAQLAMMLEADISEESTSTLRAVVTAGAPLARAVAEQVERRMSTRIVSIYGATDGGLPCFTRIDDPAATRFTTVGRVTAGHTVRLVNDAGGPVPDGVVGEVTWSGPTKSYGYLNQPELDASAWSDGYFQSKDLGVFDRADNLAIVGRKTDMILRGGNNIYPAEIENALHDLPAVAQVAVVGVPDAVMGERSCAVVVPSRGERVTLTELREFLLDRGFARYKTPDYLVCADDLPRNAGGKLNRAAIRQIARNHLTNT
jgi:acyl-CoA synthetase (AMP-forming)/AMP-acid ligase II